VTTVVSPAGLLAGKHVVVTGGAQGIGAAVAREVLSHGAHVTSMSRRAETNSEQFVYYISADVTDPEQVRRAFERAVEHFGPVGILVNNAGQAASAPFLKTDAELWRRLLAVNLDGAYHCTQAALRGMLAAGWGRVVNIASIAGLKGAKYISAYCASKHALVGLTRALAVEFATKGITVNAVCPGYTQTEMLKETIANITAKTGRTAEQTVAELVQSNPQKRLVTPEQVANAVTWLCLPGSDAVTGQAIVVTGGEVA
jgi:NAD(P)-dependent dehydrogenase (short-subunit alcohol dehydrogenase family)